MTIEPTILVTEHARWRAAERFPWFDTVTIEAEVREALSAGRIATGRAHLGLHPLPDPDSLYVWTPDGLRVYSLRHTDEAFYVTTTMRAKERP